MNKLGFNLYVYNVLDIIWSDEKNNSNEISFHVEDVISKEKYEVENHGNFENFKPKKDFNLKTNRKLKKDVFL